MKVSVIVATFGEERWHAKALARAVPSIDAQTFRPHDILVIHGRTLAQARNAGAAEAEGDWLCFLDADDELEPGYLAAMAAALDVWAADSYTGEHGHGPEVLLVPAVRYVEERRVMRVGEPRVLNDGRPLIDINRAVIGTLITRSLFDEAGGFAEWPIYEDWALWLRCETLGATLVDVPDAVYRAYRRPVSRNTHNASAHRYYDEIRSAEIALREGRA